jgi:nucleoside 2-deoxyribosyltransferase
MKFYLSGTITHAPEHMVEVYSAVATVLEALGHDVFVPICEDDEDVDVFRRDLEQIADSDYMVAFLDYPSTGTGYELAEARRLGVSVIPVYDLETVCQNPFVSDLIDVLENEWHKKSPPTRGQ